jgi:hypothetical protein
VNVSEQDEFLLNAYVDGELDPVEAPCASNGAWAPNLH